VEFRNDVGDSCSQAPRGNLDVTIDEFIAQVNKRLPPAPPEGLERLEALLSNKLPDDYRYFLINCNGGYIGGRFWFLGKNPDGRDDDAGVHHIGGFRDESYFSLFWARDCYDGRIPRALLWIADDPFGNAICLGIADPYYGKIYFWDHENEPDMEWNGDVETAGNVVLISNSFTEFVGGLREPDEAELEA
jgi:hypothetical protein